jgi:hypothetical protein
MSGHLWHINRVWFGVFFSFWCLCFSTFCIKKFSFYLILEFLNLHFSRFDFMFILCLFVFDFGNRLKKFISFSLNFSKIFLMLLLHVCDFVFQIICFFFRLFKFGLQPWNLSSKVIWLIFSFLNLLSEFISMVKILNSLFKHIIDWIYCFLNIRGSSSEKISNCWHSVLHLCFLNVIKFMNELCHNLILIVLILV